jgi:3-hydroxyisobutyrate dehydrogenase-like beta-hydroxyacid dehydrogenase
VIGFVGLGKMGIPMCKRLLAAGHELVVHNRSRDAVIALSADGAQPAGSAMEVARSAEVVITALPTTDSVVAVFEEFAHEARPGQLYIDHSTVSPAVSRLCATLVEARGSHFLDAPVSGGPAGAASGTLTVMVGGEAAILDRARPVLSAYAANVRLCGTVGSGQAVKLVNQLLVALHTAAIAEAAVFGVKIGADPQILLEVLGTSFGGSTMMNRNLPRFISRDFAGATPVQLILKDLGLIHQLAMEVKSPLLLGALIEQRFLEASARGWANSDMAALVKLWEESSGIKVGAAEDEQANP